MDFTVPAAVTLSGIDAATAAGTAIPLAGTMLAPLAGALGIRRRRRGA